MTVFWDTYSRPPAQRKYVALEIATRGYVLESGSIVNAPAASELREDPKIREAYLGAI